MASFQLGTDYPRERFVQPALERHFYAPDYEPLEVGQVDLACVHRPSGERWIIEAKGVTSDVGASRFSMRRTAGSLQSRRVSRRGSSELGSAHRTGGFRNHDRGARDPDAMNAPP